MVTELMITKLMVVGAFVCTTITEESRGKLLLEQMAYRPFQNRYKLLRGMFFGLNGSGSIFGVHGCEGNSCQSILAHAA